MASTFDILVMKDRTGWWTAYERSPIPGQNPIAVLSRRTREETEEAAIEYLRKKGSLFKAERSVVGA